MLNFGPDGLIPVVIQDARSGEVLTLAYANREALDLTLRTRQTHLWSRSRQELWRKGATSGHTQEVVSVQVDCDGDAVIYQVHRQGPACHTGAGSCFHEPLQGEPARPLGTLLAALYALIEQRKADRPEGSYTTYLFEKGVDKICKKIGEEATEVVVAIKNGDPGPIASEAADLLYHLLVGLSASGTDLEAVAGALTERLGRHGRLPSGRERPE